MPPAPEVNRGPSRGRMLFAAAVVALTVVALWTFIDYRTQPPPPPAAAAVAAPL